MKKTKYIFIGFFATMLLAGCGEEFLDQDNLYEKTDVDFYKTPQDIAEALTGAYSVLPSNGGANNPTVMANLMSDDCLGGGGSGDITFHDLDAFTNKQENNYTGLWEEYYKGILRLNMLIKRFDQATFPNETEKNQAKGEAYFLRSYYYFTLARFFGNVPLKIEPAMGTFPKAEADVLYGQIASDMKNAIELMPAIPFSNIGKERTGHVNKWIAEGMMARIFLFYTGYYQKTELPLAEGGSINKSQVITWVDDCINNSGYALVPEFRNLWAYSYINDGQYPYATNNNLSWVGDAGSPTNTESMFVVKYSVYGGWNAPNKVPYSNQLCLYMTMRIQDGTMIPWSNGWGAGPVSPQLKDAFEANDIRMKGSIIDVTDPEEGNVTTLYNNNTSQNMHETGYWNKKYSAVQKKIGNAISGIFVEIVPGTQTNNQLWNLQDEILLRFADVLLMGAELGSPNAQSYLDRVRARVGLASVPATLDNIKRERRSELAFEGVRYFDLLRWHDAEAAFAKQVNIPVVNDGVPTTYNATFRPETGGFLPIPETEIRLSNDVIEQNPGW